MHPWLKPAVIVTTMMLSVLPAAALTYPDSPKSDASTTFFGQKVADPYRWLENVDAPETLSWVKAQQALTDPYLQALPERAAFEQRLGVLWNYARRTSPKVVGAQRFYLHNDGLMNQPQLRVDDANGTRTLLDPNQLAKDGTTALTQYLPSHSGKHLLYALAEAGSDWESLRILDVASGKPLEDVIPRAKFTALTLTHDAQAVIYSTYPGAAAGTFAKLERHSLYWHRVGTPASSDTRIYTPENPQWNANAELTDDGRYLLVITSQGATAEQRVAIHDLGDAMAPRFSPKPLAVLGGDFKSSFEYLGNEGSRFYWLTSAGAPNQKIIAMDLAKPKQWQTVVPESEQPIAGAALAGGVLIVQRMADAAATVSRYGTDGRLLGTVALPARGDVSGWETRADNTEAYFQFVSFNRPASTYRLDVATGIVTLEWAPQLPFNPDDYVTEQFFARSRDGTAVPFTVSYKKGLSKNGANPTLLWGYGGFNISLLPSFSPQNLAWMEKGGIFAQANMRGGGEYGEAWHKAGTKGQKQNVFDDFAAVAEHLVTLGYTSPQHLGIYGRSNGGLLVGASINQRPELFGAAVAGVGVLDMLRFHLPSFTIGHAWRPDYGSSETREGFTYLKKYSPLHNVRPNVATPPTLVITADHDDRVVPGHSFKFAAALQAANAQNPNPQLIRIEERGGHGAGKPVAKKIAEVADVLAFLWHHTQ